MKQRDSLFLHGAGHERAVDTVLFDKRNKARGGTENFFVSGVDMGDKVRGDLTRATVDAGGDPFFNEFALVVQLDRSVSDNHALFGFGVDVDNFVGDFAVLDDAIRRFDETVLVDASISREVKHETDVATFWRLNGTDTTVVSRVSIANIEAGALAGQTARAHTRQTTFVSKLRVTVNLVHEL